MFFNRYTFKDIGTYLVPGQPGIKESLKRAQDHKQTTNDTANKSKIQKHESTDRFSRAEFSEPLNSQPLRVNCELW